MKGFKDFLMKGNVIDLATAVIVGAAFTAIVKAFTDYIITPLLATIGGTNAADGLGIRILKDNPKTFLDFGAVISAAINFIIVAAIVYFVLILPYEKLKERTAKDGDDAALTESELLTEIRDLLAGKDPKADKSTEEQKSFDEKPEYTGVSASPNGPGQPTTQVPAQGRSGLSGRPLSEQPSPSQPGAGQPGAGQQGPGSGPQSGQYGQGSYGQGQPGQPGPSQQGPGQQGSGQFGSGQGGQSGYAVGPGGPGTGPLPPVPPQGPPPGYSNPPSGGFAQPGYPQNQPPRYSDYPEQGGGGRHSQ